MGQTTRLSKQNGFPRQIGSTLLGYRECDWEAGGIGQGLMNRRRITTERLIDGGLALNQRLKEVSSCAVEKTVLNTAGNSVILSAVCHNASR